MAFLSAAIPFLSSAAGIATGIKSLVNKPKSSSAPAPTPAPLPDKPTIEKAETKAGVDVARRRKISALSGGVTNLTRGNALVPEANIGRKSLLGQ